MIMSKSVKKIISSLMCVMALIIGVCSFSFNSSASGVNNGLEFYVNYPEPAIGDSSGYITLLCRLNDSGELALQTFFWTSSVIDSTGMSMDNTVDLTVRSDSLTFGMSGFSTAYEAVYNINCWGFDGRLIPFGTYKNQAYEYRLSDECNAQIVAYKLGGNAVIRDTTVYNDNYLFSVFYSTDGSAMLLLDVMTLLENNYLLDSSILSTVQSILLSANTVETQLEAVITYLRVISNQIVFIADDLEEIYDKADEILTEQKKSNSWLQNIWESIQKFFSPDDDDKQKTDDYNNKSDSQKNEMDELNKDNQVDTPDIDDSSNAVDENIDYDSMDEYSGVLAVIVNNKFVIQMILISVSIVIIGYVLFGKR